ncbi:hypothetical protein AB4440_23260 [Vibrio splendidus]|uniref:DUF6933 domain-containing protein n=1 Tax=Vibrio splendidus TaxID=29497 RepID=UPI000C82BF57|nr:hypothetical protein [Vibrio splendidus]PMO90280.1 hypothetical protein BCS97_23380 [Vibrio splendidus]PMP33854.1 hypothetical protein BCS87_21360 [Vibrio splendidus]PMP46680.1 hypothetical protein BCS85_14670 [Vibrio splendidus]PMP58996.1 hypothetical protein BCS83_23730 [Vibrio splendidus]
MLVFNCTKAAADFFTVTRQGKKISSLEPAPHKTIAESIEHPVYPDGVDANRYDGLLWHWVLHCVSIKRKKYLIAMDYNTRACITVLAGKKGDIYQFLNTFEPMLKAYFHSIAHESGVDSLEIENCIDHYDREVNDCAFHPRSDRSVQTHINDVHWHLERHCYEDGMLLEDLDLLGFNIFASQFSRNSKHRKGHFFPNDEFVREWREWALEATLEDSALDMSNVVALDKYR